MHSRSINFTIAICASLILHVGFMTYSAYRYATAQNLYLAPIWHRENSITLNLEEPKQPDLSVHDELGERNAKGIAANSSQGDRPLQAPEADLDQAFLDRNPSSSGRKTATPVDRTAPAGEGGHGGEIGSAAQDRRQIDEPPIPPAYPSAIVQAEIPSRPPAVTALKPAEAAAISPVRRTDLPAAAASPAVPVPGAARADQPLAAAEKAQPDAPMPLKEQSSDARGLAYPPPDPSRKGESFSQYALAPAAAPPPDTRLGRELPAALAKGRLQRDTEGTQVAIAVPISAPPVPQAALPAPPQPQHAATPSPTIAPATSAAHAAARPATGDGRAPGRPARANPTPQSDSDSDAFAKIGSAVYHNGRLEVREGRKVRTTRPQILVPGLLDEFGLANPTVVLKVNIDATGNVTNVDVFRSSGSNDLDQPCLRAVYDWWFEPARDASGKAVPDAVLFAITFR